MGKMKLILFVFAFLFISLASADLYKLGNPINIEHSVRIDGAPTTSAVCNITVWNPENKRLINFSQMTPQTSSKTYNFTVNQNFTNSIGTYRYDITCLQAGLNQTDTFSYDITPSGKEYSTAQSITYFFLFLIAIFFFIFFTVGFMNIQWTNDPDDLGGDITKINYKKYLKPMFFIFSYGSLIIISYMAWDISAGVLFFQGIGKFFWFISRFLLSLAMPFFIIVMAISVFRFIQDKKLQNLMEQGFSFSEKGEKF